MAVVLYLGRGLLAACVPSQTNIVLFAYSTDIDYNTFRLGAQNLVRYSIFNKKLANVRFDTKEEEEIEYHTDNKSFNASIFSHPPDPSLGYGDTTTGSNLYNVLKKFLNNKTFSTCGAIVVILVKRYPNESNVSDIIYQLRSNHILVYITVDSVPSGGSNSATLFEMSSKTNGYCVFASDYDLIFAFQNMGAILYTPYQFLAQNFVVTGSGSLELPVFKTPIPEGWVQWTRVVITVQDHTLDNSFVSVNYTIASTDGVVAYQYPNDHADRRHGTGQADLVASNGSLHYKWTIDYQYSTNAPQIIECRMYSYSYHDFLPLPDY